MRLALASRRSRPSGSPARVLLRSASALKNRTDSAFGSARPARSA
jgi:hypothetical protein